MHFCILTRTPALPGPRCVRRDTHPLSSKRRTIAVGCFRPSRRSNAYTTGIDLEGKSIKETTDFQMLLNGRDHMWTVSDDAKLGVVAYLRALPPKGFPEDDE